MVDFQFSNLNKMPQHNTTFAPSSKEKEDPRLIINNLKKIISILTPLVLNTENNLLKGHSIHLSNFSDKINNLQELQGLQNSLSRVPQSFNLSEVVNSLQQIQKNAKKIDSMISTNNQYVDLYNTTLAKKKNPQKYNKFEECNFCGDKETPKICIPCKSNHKFCQKCISKYFKYIGSEIPNGEFQFKCPFYYCDYYLTRVDLEKLLGDNYYQYFANRLMLAPKPNQCLMCTTVCDPDQLLPLKIIRLHGNHYVCELCLKKFLFQNNHLIKLAEKNIRAVTHEIPFDVIACPFENCNYEVKFFHFSQILSKNEEINILRKLLEKNDFKFTRKILPSISSPSRPLKPKCHFCSGTSGLGAKFSKCAPECIFRFCKSHSESCINLINSSNGQCPICSQEVAPFVLNKIKDGIWKFEPEEFKLEEVKKLPEFEIKKIENSSETQNLPNENKKDQSIPPPKKQVQEEKKAEPPKNAQQKKIINIGHCYKCQSKTNISMPFESCEENCEFRVCKDHQNEFGRKIFKTKKCIHCDKPIDNKFLNLLMLSKYPLIESTAK